MLNMHSSKCQFFHFEITKVSVEYLNESPSLFLKKQVQSRNYDPWAFQVAPPQSKVLVYNQGVMKYT